MSATLTAPEAKLFLALLNGEVPNIAWIMEGGDPFHNFLSEYGMTETEFDALFDKLSEVTARAGAPTLGWSPMTKGTPAFHNPKAPAMTIELEDDGSAWYVAQGLKIKNTFPTFAKAVAHVRSLS